MSNRMRSSRYIGIALFIIMCCCILTGCRSHNSSVQELRNEEVVVQSTPIPQDTTIFNYGITSSAGGTYHVYFARTTQTLVDFLEWLDTSKYEVYQILMDGYDFYIIYRDISYEQAEWIILHYNYKGVTWIDAEI